MYISMLTTTFPKFPSDSHGPWILAMAKDLVRDGDRVKVVAPSANDIVQNKENFSGVEIIRFRYMLKPLEQVAYGANIPANVRTNKIAKLAFPFFIVGFFWAAIKHLFDSDIVHAQFGYSGVFATVAGKWIGNKKPIIISFYGRDLAHSYKYSKLYNFAFREAKKILVLSHDMKEGLIQAGCPQEKILVHHLGVNLNQFDSFSTTTKKDQNQVTLLVVANFVEKKGIDQAIHAFARVLKNDQLKDKKITLRLVGRGPQEQELKALVKQYNLDGRVLFINNYLSENPRQVVIEEMKNADIFVLPSIPVGGDYGGTPVVLMEASAMRLPVITTHDAGNSEIILNNKTGYVLEAKQVDQLVGAMEKLILNPELRAQFGEAGYHYVATEFNHERQMIALKKIYADVLKN